MAANVQSIKSMMKNESLLIIAAVLALVSMFFASSDVV